MSIFSKAKKYRKPSRSIDEKVKLLNQDLKKTGVVTEDAPANSTKHIYNTFRYHPSTEAEFTDVPDPDGVRSDGWNQPSNGFDVDDPATWENAFNDFSWLYNPNDVAGETDRPVTDSIDVNWIGGVAGAGMMLAHIGWGQSLGYLSNGGVYQPLVTAGSMSSGMIPPIERGSHFDGAHYQYSIPDDKWAAMQSIWAKYQEIIDAGNVATKTIKVWYPWSYFFNGSWETVGYPKRESDKHILINATYLTKANGYKSQDKAPAHNEVLTRDSISDGSYFPGDVGPFLDWLRKALDVSKEALDWLFEVAEDERDNTLGTDIDCLLYTSPSPRDVEECRMPSSA